MSTKILPFYLVCDESYSMSDHLTVIRDSLREVYRAVSSDPTARRRTRLCLIGFSTGARVVMELSRQWDEEPEFEFRPGEGTNFAAAFTVLRDTIETDVADLHASGHEVLRPVVFFLSDGQPTDTAWRRAHARLTDSSWPARPQVIAFGVGDADARTIGRVGSFRAYLGSGVVGTGEALRQCIRALARTMLHTGAADIVRFADVAGFEPALSTSHPDLVHIGR